MKEDLEIDEPQLNAQPGSEVKEEGVMVELLKPLYILELPTW